ncbi:hypothetical protein RIF29_37583 [Crotalaria pallida]|uniref:RRM domain-containing protein n=1 Tax=Crotalaria pallida TaxID=3830 RepID=A0AAN9HUX7_CROPI
MLSSLHRPTDALQSSAATTTTTRSGPYYSLQLQHPTRLSFSPQIFDMAASVTAASSVSSKCLHQFLLFRAMSSKIFVKGLAFCTTEDKLAQAFSRYGDVLNANIVLNKAKTRSKGFGYVTFANEEEARMAQISMNRKILDGRVLYVDMQPPRKQKN